MRKDIVGVKISIKRILIFLLVFSSLVPHIGFNISLFGFNWTLYRISILVCIVIYIFAVKRYKVLFVRRTYTFWICLMIFWMAYGLVLLFTSKYSDLHKGTLEIFSIFNGLISICILISVLHNIEDVNFMFGVIYYVYIALVVIGVFEIITDVHFATSAFNDMTIDNYNNRKGATAVFYGENDFSAFLSCFAPIMLYKRKRFIGIITFVGALFINYVNDANICMMAIIIGIVFYLLFIKRYKIHGQFVIKTFIVFIMIVLATILIKSKGVINEIPLLAVIKEQHFNAKIGQGSLYSRLLLYSDSIKAAVNTHFMGVGPFGFTNYFNAHPSGSNLVNPHNYYLEILVEYGAIISIAFCVCLFGTIIRLLKNNSIDMNKNNKCKVIIGCEMLVVFSICCISPSSFIGYSWQWILICVSIVASNVPNYVTEENNFIGEVRNKPLLSRKGMVRE